MLFPDLPHRRAVDFVRQRAQAPRSRNPCLFRGYRPIRSDCRKTPLQNMSLLLETGTFAPVSKIPRFRNSSDCYPKDPVRATTPKPEELCLCKTINGWFLWFGHASASINLLSFRCRVSERFLLYLSLSVRILFAVYTSAQTLCDIHFCTLSVPSYLFHFLFVKPSRY